MSFVVLYFYQGEPGEALETPNCFPLPKGETNPTYGQFLDRFPPSARRGQMHFRFKEEDWTHGYVWRDVNDRQAPLPMSRDGVITCKILCLDVAHAQRRYSRLRLKKTLDPGAEGMADYLKSRELAAFSVPKGLTLGGRRSGNGDGASASTSSSSSSKSRPSRYVDDGDDDDDGQGAEVSSGRDIGAAQFAPSSPGQRRAAAPATASSSSSSSSSSSLSGRNGSQAVDNLLDDDTHTARSAVKPLAATQGRHSQQQQQPQQQQQRQTAPSANGISSSSSSSSRQTAPALAPAPAPAPPPPQQQPPAEPALTREELAARREAQVEENVENALRGKQERDERQRKEADALDEARVKHDKNLTSWQTVNKEKRNVRTLLTTMHNVLWQGNTWKPVGLGDVIEPKQVKLQYRKAMLVVHPDKVVDKPMETQFIAKRIFEGLNEAYKQFEEKEEMT